MTWTRRDLLIGASCALVATALPTIASASATFLDGGAFGTYWRVGLAKGNDTAAVRAALESTITAIDEALSPFRDDSEISRFNQATEIDWQPLSSHCAAVASEGLRIARITDGAFDPTVGGIVGRFGFGPIHSNVEATYADLALQDGALRKTKPGVTFDPCGIAKGYALDAMANALDRLGIDAYLIDIGGEALARGAHPDGRPWQVGIERPQAGELAFQRILHLNGQAVATSGDSVNSYEVGGRRLSHIIDPRTERPAEGNLASVSVVSSTAMTADALATALFALGAADGARFARDRRIPALFLVRDGDNLSEITTPSLSPYILA